eukprot:8720967-Pyramimonas_sp.AAC.1
MQRKPHIDFYALCHHVLVASTPQPCGALKWQEFAGLMIDDDHVPCTTPRAQGSEVVHWDVGFTS